jgi:hypothetical protein
MHPLGYADTFDPSQSNLIFILVAAGGIAVIGVMAALVIFLARRNTPRVTQPLITTALFWGAVSVGLLLYTTLQQLGWQKQFNQDLMSGYGDPQAVGPGLHLSIWFALATAYGLMIAVTLATRTSK